MFVYVVAKKIGRNACFVLEIQRLGEQLSLMNPHSESSAGSQDSATQVQ